MVGGFLELEGVLEFALEIAVRRKGKAFRRLALGVKSEKLVGHVLDGFARAGLASVPDSATEFVQRRMGAFEDAIRLDEVHAFEGNVQAGIFSVFQQHEFAAVAAGFDLAKSFKLADAVVHVDHVVAGFQLCKIAEETGGANLATGTLDGRGDVEKIGVAKECEAGFRKRDTFGEGRANQQHRRRFLRAFGGEASGSIFRFAEDVGNFVFAANVSKALDFSRACGGQENGSTGSELGLHVTHAGNDIAVKTGAGTRGKLELRRGTDCESELFDVNLRRFFESGGKFLFSPKIMRGGG